MIIIAFTECLLVADAELFHLLFTTTLCIEYCFYAHFTDEGTGTLSNWYVQSYTSRKAELKSNPSLMLQHIISAVLRYCDRGREGNNIYREKTLCVDVGVCYTQRKEEGVGWGIVSVFKLLHSCHKKRLSFSLSFFKWFHMLFYFGWTNFCPFTQNNFLTIKVTQIWDNLPWR